MIHRGNGAITDGPNWPEVPVRTYDGSSAIGATKRVLIGQRDGAENFAMRYFEVPAGQSSAHETHPHEHGVIVTRGCARVMLGVETHDVTVGDVIFIGPNEPHRFDAIGPEPLGFLCVVPGWAERGGRRTLADDSREPT